VSGVTFQSAQWLWALLLIPALALAGLAWARRGRRAADTWAQGGVLAVRPPARERWARAVAAVLVLCAVAAAVVAMARPSGLATEDERRSTVVLTVDVSASMNRTDLAPNRLVAAIGAANRFIDEAPDHTAIGLVTFAKGARVVVAPTRDRARLRDALAELETIRGRTALGEAVVTALASLRSEGAIAEGAPDPTTSPGRMLILTDGVDTARNATTPQQAAERTAAAGVPIFTILLGDDPGEEGSATPAETLSSMSTRTGGVFAQTATGADLRAVFDDIGGIVAPVERLRERTVWWAAAALLFLLAALAVMGLARPARGADHPPE
jgi:Ca-activated chloride channel family protein